MTADPYTIERLTLPASNRDIRTLAQLLVETVASGAAVSFLAPLAMDQAEDWWRKTLSNLHPRAVCLVTREAGDIIGTVQFHPAWAPNQPFRADVVKLMVNQRCRQSGLGARLMQAIEREALSAGYTLLTLDAKDGGAAVRLYRRLGWVEVGAIPNYALDPDGQNRHATVIFYKQQA